MNEIKLKNCPFCGSNKIGYSIKTCGSYRGQYHVAMYCKDCNCYGKRTLIKPTETARWEIEKNESYKELAIQAWNTRKSIDDLNIIHCKDCKHWGTGVAGETENVKCCEHGKYMVGDNGYCVYGEKECAE